MKNKLTVNIMGVTGSGKTVLADKISNFLKGVGYTVNYSMDGDTKFTALPKKVMLNHVLDTVVEINEVQIRRKTITDKDPLDTTIQELNRTSVFGPQVLYIKKDSSLSNYRTIELLESSIVVQETNIPDYYFIHKSRRCKDNILVTTHELIELLKENYELN